MSKPKYEPGKVLTFPEVIERIEKSQYIYWHHKPQHPSWMMSNRLIVLKQAAENGILREARELCSR